MAVDKAIGVVALVAVLVVGGTLLLAAVELRHAAHVQTPGRSEGLCCGLIKVDTEIRVVRWE